MESGSETGTGTGTEPRTGPNRAEGRMVFSVNGVHLVGEKLGGRWSFTCPTFPDLETRFRGVADTIAATSEFMARALAATEAVRSAG